MAARTNMEENHRLTGGLYDRGSNRSENYSFVAVRPSLAVGGFNRTASSDSLQESSLSPHGRSLREAMTIRAVTPESELEFEDAMVPEDAATKPQDATSTPPRTPSRSNNRSLARWDLFGRSSPEPNAPSSPEKLKNVLVKTNMSTTQLADRGISRAKSRSPTERMWHRAPVDDNSDFARQRYAPPLSTPSSGSLPSSMAASSTQSLVSNRPTTKPPHRRLLKSQASLGALQAQQSSRDPTPSPVITTEYDTLIRLMKDLQGRLEGMVEYRVNDIMIWSKGFCRVDDKTGQFLRLRGERDTKPPLVVIPDLRGCTVRSATRPEDKDGIIEITTHSSKMNMKLRPLNEQQYESWLAALLCWTPISPAGAQNKRVKPQTSVLAREKRPERRRNSDVGAMGGSTIIKIGNMLLWQPTAVSPSSSSSSKPSSKGKGLQSLAWQRISCTLQENGEFRLHSQSDSQCLAIIHLNQLSRCAVQQLDPSILDQEFCIAIYPQYTPTAADRPSAKPLYLGIDTRILFEVWFVLLRAFTMPELYGPARIGPIPPQVDPNGTFSETASLASVNASLADSYRMQRSLFLRVVEGKITTNLSEKELDCYAEVMLDGEVRAKTMVRTRTNNPFWREDYEFPDIPTVLTDVAVVVKQRDPRWKTKATATASGPGGFGGGLGGAVISGWKDQKIGKVDVHLGELTVEENEKERWYPLMSGSKGSEEKVGEMFLKLELEELVVLMEEEYKGMSELLHKFESGLTIKLARILAPDLRRLSDTLLKIFQVSNKAGDWIMALAENEIDGLHKEGPLSSPEKGGEAAARSAKGGLGDANILFRGNSLLTKSLDAHMKRLGREYLEDTLKSHLTRIAEEDTYCEVDPMRIEGSEGVGKNWRTLMSLTRSIWATIYSSPQRCPVELRRILRHIKSCVEVRYGDLLRTVRYSSVCGFLFLRFFCPAILNPKLFGLLKDHPGVRAQRTLTLIAKSLQGLANMSTFGVKEPWMAPMNEFLEEHTAELKDFVDTITDIPPAIDKAPRPIPPSYATPITILSRLSQSSKEGFPSLPYLIDQPRAFASLVVMWDKWYPVHCARFPNQQPLDGDLAEFDSICRHIKERVRICIEKAENAERPGRDMSDRWEEVAEKVTGMPASTGVYEQLPGARGHQRVVTADGLVVHGTHPPDLPTTGYTVAAYSTTGNGRSKLSVSGFVGGFRKKSKAPREE